MKTFKIILFAILIIALSITATALISKGTDGFNKSFSTLFLNEDNLVHTLEEYESKAGNSGNGITWKINENTGAITASGTIAESDTATAAEFKLGSVKIEKTDYYTLSGVKGGSLDTFYIKAEYEDLSGNQKVIYGDFTDSMTSEDKIAEGTYVSITIVINPGVELENVKFTPTFVAGEEKGSF